ncbi:uncharacterized protein LOC119350053 [Triticum dicoccoides]|uniref:uncharacterized protein LOC119350053 n=1 Tax=Triticum dicoccoides TaxID=85692 RepID=UPI00188EFB1D|nr:uncharacterized protein LOC119350053 [Triticum dicoccoides]
MICDIIDDILDFLPTQTWGGSRSFPPDPAQRPGLPRRRGRDKAATRSPHASPASPHSLLSPFLPSLFPLRSASPHAVDAGDYAPPGGPHLADESGSTTVVCLVSFTSGSGPGSLNADALNLFFPAPSAPVVVDPPPSLHLGLPKSAASTAMKESRSQMTPLTTATTPRACCLQIGLESWRINILYKFDIIADRN